MRLVPYDMNQFKKEVRPYTNNMKFIEQFYDSDLTCVKVEDYTHKNAKTCANCLYTACKILRLEDRIKVRTFGENVFLIKVK